MEEKVKVTDPEVLKRLDKIDWDSLKKATGITRDQIEGMPSVAKQLVYQQMTGLVYGSTPDISGQFSLRAIPGKNEGDLMRVKAYTIEKEKTIDDDLYLYGARITSQGAKNALFERTSWLNSEGKKVFGNANLNAGRPIAVVSEGPDGKPQKTEYLVAIHKDTNRVIGIPCDAVRRMLSGTNEDGTVRTASVYGVTLSPEQCETLAKGGHVYLKGCKAGDGTEFETAVQFDPVRRQLAPSHPTSIKQAQAMGYGVDEAEKQTQAKAESKKEAKPIAEAPKNEEKKGAKHHIG